MDQPVRARLSLITGKGGVGKSTLVAARALAAAERGERPLIVELGHRASMQAIFAVPEVGHAPTLVAPGVHASNIDLDEALGDYVAQHVPVRPLAQRIAQSRSLRRFFDAAPAVGEVLTLQRLEQLLEGDWDPILVDFDSTGHARMFLELPAVFEGLVPDGPVRRLLDSFAGLLAERTTRLDLVTLPAALPVQETLELYARVRADHTLSIGAIYVNRMPTDPLPDDARPLLTELLERTPQDHAARVPLYRLGVAVAEARAAGEQLARLRELDEAVVVLPRVHAEMNVERLRELGRAIDGGSR